MPATVAARPDDTVALAETLRPALLRLARRLRQEAQKVGVSPLDAVILGRILAGPGIGVCELAEQEQISRPTMSGHVKRLEAAGWLARTEDARDGRRSGLVITPAGERRLSEVRRRRNDWLANRLSRLTPAARERLAEAAEPLLQLLALEA